jgi:alpha-L-fucosidase
LNIGPRADGTIPEREQEILLDIGRWLRTYGEAVYGTRPWRVFGEGPTEVVAGQFRDTDRAEFTPADIRYTTRGDTVFAIVMARPADGRVRLRSLAPGSGLFGAGVGSVTLVGSEDALSWRGEPESLVVDVGSLEREDWPFALRITEKRQ